MKKLFSLLLSISMLLSIIAIDNNVSYGKEKEVDSIEFIPNKTVLIDGIDMSYKRIGQYDYFRYYNYVPQGNRLIVKYDDDSVKEFIGQSKQNRFDNSIYTSLDGETISGISFAGENYSSREIAYGINVVTVEYANKTTSFNVTVNENPVESISYTPASQIYVKYYDINDSDCTWTQESVSHDGDVLTVNYKDFTSKNYTLINGNYYDENGEIIDKSLFFGFYDNQAFTDYCWKFGQQNYIYFEYADCNAKIPIVLTIDDYTETPTIKPSTAESTTTVSSANNTTSKTFVTTTTQYADQPTTKKAAVLKPKSNKIKKVAKGNKSIAVTWLKVSGVKGYQVQVATDKKFKKNKKTVTIKKQKTTKTTVKKLKAKKKYYVRVRTYKIANGKKVYSSWSKVKSVKTK